MVTLFFKKRKGGERISHSLQPKSGARLQASEYSQTRMIMRQVRLLEVHPMACKGFVMTM